MYTRPYKPSTEQNQSWSWEMGLYLPVEEAEQVGSNRRPALQCTMTETDEHVLSVEDHTNFW